MKTVTNSFVYAVGTEYVPTQFLRVMPYLCLTLLAVAGFRMKDKGKVKRRADVDGIKSQQLNDGNLTASAGIMWMCCP